MGLVKVITVFFSATLYVSGTAIPATTYSKVMIRDEAGSAFVGGTLTDGGRLLRRAETDAADDSMAAEERFIMRIWRNYVKKYVVDMKNAKKAKEVATRLQQ
ncbi:hypothetical protein L916_14774 [Phytophthora nicotianae]|uniref:RxLR effector protein n=1 Tax=Phytophthora nicotianae TaxID=4792 RepID=W2IEJ6_PHYNI|nr:hypothetical protein L916_14774 [Phytophthora nicotianae]